MNISNNDIKKIEDLEDGSSVYEINDAVSPEVEEATERQTDFYKNLADGDIPENDLNKISAFLLDAIDEDIESRKDWMDSVEKAKTYLGFSLEDLNKKTLKQCSKTFDTTLATALIRFYATVRSEILPASGPAGYIINGQATDELDDKGAKVRDGLNYYLTKVDQGYYPDFERFFLFLGLYGSGFKKIYRNNSSSTPVSRFIIPQDFIVDNDCASILESNRLTHVLHLSKREIILNIQNKLYRKVELSYLKSNNSANDEDDDSLNKFKSDVNLDAYTRRSLFPIYEVHTYLNLNDFSDNSSENEEHSLPLPYVVTIDKITREILAIRKNWEEDDPETKMKDYFVHYNYLPGFGIYGLGLAHLIGSNAITLTTLQRLLVDAGCFKNLPGGLRVKGFKEQDDEIAVAPGHFVQVDTGGVPLQDSFMPLPYSEPSQVLRELRLEIMEQTRELGSTSEMGMLDSKEDIPVGTAMAFLETNNKIQSVVLRSIHHSLSRELQLIYKLFQETVAEIGFKFSNPNRQTNLEQEDFAEEIEIIPTSDPTTNSSMMRLMKTQAMTQLAMQAPELHNMREIYKLNYLAFGISQSDIDKILKPDPETEEILPLDPFSENINALMGKPLKVALWQDHSAHKLLHGIFARENSEETSAELAAHIKEHEAAEYLIKIQESLGIELPSLEQLQDPQIQNAIALMGAKTFGNQQLSQEEASQPIDPNTLIMADIKQKEAEIIAKEKIANLKAETDIFKAQLDFEKAKAQIESAEDIAKLKTETELTKQGVNDE